VKIFNFNTHSGINNFSYSKPLIEENYWVSEDLNGFELVDKKEVTDFSYVEKGNYAIGKVDGFYLWRESKNAFSFENISIDKSFIYRGVFSGNYLFTKGVLEQELYFYDQESKRLVQKKEYEGNFIFCNESLYVISYRGSKEIVAYDSQNNVLWCYKVKPKKLKTIKSKGISFFISANELHALDLTSGELTFIRQGERSLRDVVDIDNYSYLFLSDRICLFDHNKNIIVKELVIPIERDFSFYDQFLFLANRDEKSISCYDRFSLKLIKKQVFNNGFKPTGGGFIVYQGIAIISLSSGSSIDSVGKSYKSVFCLDEFFSDNFQQEIEADYFEVHEEADIEDGNVLRITIDTSINFDTLYRHLSVALQNIPFRHGNYGWAATLDEEKPVNENFNGKVIADLSDHAFTSEQRDLLEEVIQEAMEFYANRQITSGDGKGTPCYVVSVIPVAE